jgi:hypothetical protein
MDDWQNSEWFRASLPGLWFKDGVYYAEIRHPASESPMRVALHGISTPQEACKALSLLAQGPCSVVPELALPVSCCFRQ